MSNIICSSDGRVCTQAYHIKDYFLALFVIVVCLVCLRMLLYASYYSWIRLAARRQQQQLMASSALQLGYGAPFMAFGARSVDRPHLEQTQACFAPDATTLAPNADREQGQPRVCVIVAGEDRPTFIAMPAPLAPLRSQGNYGSTVVKPVDALKDDVN